MGICASCFGSSSDVTPEISPAEMRARQLAAAEKRASENASRGIGDKAKVEQWQKRKQAAEEQEQKIQAAGGTAGENALRWTSDVS